MEFFKYKALTAILLFLLRPVYCHSWVEQLTLIAPNGTFTGPTGYPRGNLLRTDPAFNDPSMTHLLPPNGRPAGAKILPSDNICKETQRSQNQTEGSPRLKASPGAPIALRYQENGHVTLPDGQPGKPPNRGYVYVYATTDPSANDTLLEIHKVWNEEGTGGDGRGILLSRQNFDDGRCYQVNGDEISTLRQSKFKHEADKVMGADMWCQQDIALPQNLPTEKPYTLYWVWDWPTAPGEDPGLPDGKTEVYTTCIDVDIVPITKVQGASKAVSNGYEKDQPLNKAAIPSQMAQLDLSIMIPSKPGSPTPTSSFTLKPSGAVPQPSPSSNPPDALIPIPPFSNSSSTTLSTPSKPSSTGLVRGFRFHRAVLTFPRQATTPNTNTEWQRDTNHPKRGSNGPSYVIEPPIEKSPRISDHKRKKWFYLW